MNISTTNTKYGSRKGLKIPIPIPNVTGQALSTDEKVEIAKTVAEAEEKKYHPKKAETTEPEEVTNNLYVRYDSSDLMVITHAKKLTSYVMTITKNSPQRYRFTFVNRMHNYCLDILENLITANSFKKDEKNKYKRKDYQHKAYVTLQLLGYISFLAYENGCILAKQYEQISIHTSNTLNLLVAWTKSE